MTRLTEKRFDRDFILTKNVFGEEAECNSWNGCFYETFGREDKYIREFPDQTRVWTLLDCDGKMYIVSGWHYVNRLGYFITEKPWDKEDYEVRV